MNTEPYLGDVLEHALNKGIISSAQRYGLSEDVVRSVVKKFADEIDKPDDEPCSCEQACMEGVITMCFMCDKGMRKTTRILT